MLAVGADGGCLDIFSIVYRFSSPEHRVVKVSFCDHPVSVVRLVSPTIYVKHISS